MKLFTSLFLFFVLFVGVGYSQPSVVYVPQDYATIQAAVNAVANEGEVIVDDGIYIFNEPVTYGIWLANKIVSIRSVNGPESTILDGNNYTNGAFLIQGPVDSGVGGPVIYGNLTISGFTIRKCRSTNSSLLRHGYDSGATVTYENLIIENNGNGSDGALAWGLLPSRTFFKNCIIRNNYITDGATIKNAHIEDCLFFGNSGRYYPTLTYRCNVINCTIINNGYSQDSTPVLHYRSVVVGEGCLVISSIIRDNDGYQGNQIYLPGAVVYSNIEGGWAGVGNMDADPMFVDSENNDYHLQVTSPGIDAGYPHYTHNDPDITRNDIGFYYYDQSCENPNVAAAFTGNERMPYKPAIMIPHLDSYNVGTGPFTLEFWFQIPNIEVPLLGLIDKYMPFVAQYLGVNVESNGILSVHVVNSSGTHFILYSTTTVDDGEWHHFAVTRNNINACLYIDGEFNSDIVIPIELSCDNPGTVNIGGFNPSIPTPNSMDEIRYWNAARTQEEISNNMYTDLGFGPFDNSLIGYWPITMDDFTNTPEYSVIDRVNPANLGKIWEAGYECDIPEQACSTCIVSVSPDFIWPPNHNMVPVVVSLNPECDVEGIVLDSVISNELDNGQGDGNTINDVQGVDAGTADFEFQVRAERSGNGSGRTYTAYYSYCGGEAIATIDVPLQEHSCPLCDPLAKAIGNWVPGTTPDDYYTMPNYPNPFNPTTTIKFGLPEDGVVRLVVYDLIGREVVVLVDNFMKSGNHSVVFNASGLTSGIYYYSIESGNFRNVSKMILLK